MTGRRIQRINRISGLAIKQCDTPRILVGGRTDKAVFIPFGRVADGRNGAQPLTRHMDEVSRAVRR